MEKRLLLAFVLSIIVLLSFNYYIGKMAPQREGLQSETSPPEAIQSLPSAQNVSRETIPLESEKPFPTMEAGESKVETTLFNGTINLNGGGLESWKVKEYKDKGGELVNLVRPERIAKNLPLYVYSPGGTNLIFRGEESLGLGENQPQGELILMARADSWEIAKRLVFADQQYLFRMDLSWKNVSSEPRQLPDYYIVCTPGFGLEDKDSQQYAEVKAGFIEGDQVKPHKWKVNSLLRRLVKRNNTTKTYSYLEVEEPAIVKWLAYRSKYFTVILKPQQEGKGILFSGMTDNELLCQLKMAGQMLKPGEVLAHSFAVYVGPIDYERLQELNLGLESIFESGLLTPLRRLVMTVLKYFYNLVGNWGVSIILLTIVIKVIMLPLTQKSFRSMKEMQKLQPQISSLRQVYKDNPQKLQKEIMELYRRHKVNPMGGCFPMLLQMPVFIALFTALRGAIELRQAPFIFWIKDLSAKDPYYVLPILMGGTMFLQQRMTPQADPQQARMAMIMPIFFTFIFLNFPSGLVLYWLVNSILSLGEQWWIKREK